MNNTQSTSLVVNLMPFELPGSVYRGRMPNKEQLEQLSEYKNKYQITHIFILQTQKEWEHFLNTDLKKLYEKEGYAVEHYPIKDGGTIAKDVMKELVGKIISVAKKGENALVHCKGGTGRTSMVLACTAMDALGCTPQVATAIFEKALGAHEKSRSNSRSTAQNDFILKYNQTTEVELKKEELPPVSTISISTASVKPKPKPQFEVTQIPFDLGGKVFRGRMPGKNELEHLGDLKNIHNITHIFLLQTDDEWKPLSCNLKTFYEEAGYKVEYFPIMDGYVPEKAEMKKIVNRVMEVAKKGDNALIHCKGGTGRTAMVLACLAKDHLGLDGNQAMDFIKIFIPFSEFTENTFQKPFILKY